LKSKALEIETSGHAELPHSHASQLGRHQMQEKARCHLSGKVVSDPNAAGADGTPVQEENAV